MKKFLLIFGINLLSTVICEEFIDKLQHIIKDIEYFNYMCKNKTNYTLSECFMIRSVKQLDTNLNSPVIELNENARLVELSAETEKYQNFKNIG